MRLLTLLQTKLDHCRAAQTRAWPAKNKQEGTEGCAGPQWKGLLPKLTDQGRHSISRWREARSAVCGAPSKWKKYERDRGGLTLDWCRDPGVVSMARRRLPRVQKALHLFPHEVWRRDRHSRTSASFLYIQQGGFCYKRKENSKNKTEQKAQENKQPETKPGHNLILPNIWGMIK